MTRRFRQCGTPALLLKAVLLCCDPERALLGPGESTAGAQVETPGQVLQGVEEASGFLVSRLWDSRYLKSLAERLFFLSFQVGRARCFAKILKVVPSY